MHILNVDFVLIIINKKSMKLKGGFLGRRFLQGQFDIFPHKHLKGTSTIHN